jgi:hypothetical protein
MSASGHSHPAGNVFQNFGRIWMNLQMTYGLSNAEKVLPAGVRRASRKNRSTLP